MCSSCAPSMGHESAPVTPDWQLFSGKKRAGWSHHSPPNGGSSVSFGVVSDDYDVDAKSLEPQMQRACQERCESARFMLELLHGSCGNRGMSTSVAGVERRLGARCNVRTEQCVHPLFSAGCACSRRQSQRTSRILRNESTSCRPYGRTGNFARLAPHTALRQGFSGADTGRNPCNSYSA